MGTVNIYRNLNSSAETVNFNGRIGDYLSFDWDHCVIIRNGEYLSRDSEVGDDDIVLIRILPEAMTAVAIIIGIAAVVGAGISVIQSYKMKKRMDDLLGSINSRNKEDTKTVPQIQGCSNQLATGNSFPFVLGKHLFTPYYLTPPYTEIDGVDGENEYFHAVLETGFRDLTIKEVRIGTDRIAVLSGSKPQNGTYRFDPGLYYNEKNLIEIRQSDNFSNSCFNKKVITERINTEIRYTDEEQTEKIVSSAKHPMEIECTLFLPSGLHRYDDKGKRHSADIEIEPAYSLDDGKTWNSFTFNFGGDKPNRLSRNNKKQMRFSAKKTFTPAEVMGKQTIKIRVKRISKQTDSNTVDNCYWQTLKTTCYDPEKVSDKLVPVMPLENDKREKCCRIGIKIAANNKTEDVLDQLNVIAQMNARIWNGSEWSATKSETSNTAAVALELLTTEVHPASKYTDEEIDLESFGKFYEFCQRHKLECNGVITKGSKKSAIIADILATADAVLVNQFGKYEVVFDDYRTNPVALLNTQNCRNIKFSKTFGRKTTGIQVTYVNAREGYRQDTCKVDRPGGQTGLSTYTEIELPYVTNRDQVFWLTRRMMAKERLRPRTAAVSVGKEGAYYPLGSLVLLQDETIKIGIGSGEIRRIIKSDNFITAVEIDAPVDLTQDNEYGAVIFAVNPEGRRVRSERIKSTGQNQNILEFETPVPVNDPRAPQTGNYVSVGLLENGDFHRVTNKMIINGCNPTESGYELTLVDYNEAIYADDGSPIPEYQSNLTDIPREYPALVDADKATRDELYEGINNIPPDIMVLPNLEVIGKKDGQLGVYQSRLYVWNSGSNQWVCIEEGILSPDDVQTVEAYAQRGHIRITIRFPYMEEQRNNIKAYIIQRSTDQGKTWVDSQGEKDGFAPAAAKEYLWKFDRNVDGYPEKTGAGTWTSLDNYRYRVKAVNVSNTLSENWTYCGTVDTSEYKTWIPGVPVMVMASAGRTVSISIDQQDWYGAAGAEFQINRDNGTTWYAPRLEANDVHQNEDAWRGTKDSVFYSASGQLTQSLPLEGQSRGLPKNTTYYYRARTVTKGEGGAVLYRSNYTGSRPAMAQATGITDIMANSISNVQIQDAAVSNAKIENGSIVAADKIKANTISTANLNVLAKNIVNPFIDGTKEGWTTDGVVVLDTELNLRVLELTGGTLGQSFLSNVFEVLPDDIYEFKLGLQCPNYTSASGLFIGLTYNQKFKNWIYDFGKNEWTGGTINTNSYFLEDYKSPAKKYFKTYILGHNVNISQVPAPTYTDKIYRIKCLQLTAPYTTCQIRQGFNATTPGTKWRLIHPQVYRIGDGKIIAQNIQTPTLSAITAQLGEVGDGPDYNLTFSEGMKNPRGTFLLGSVTDDAYLRRWKEGSVWQMAIKLKHFFVDAFASNIFGRFRIFKNGDKIESATPVFNIDPGSSPGNEATDIRGTFRVRKNSSGTADGETTVFQVSNGETRISKLAAGKFSAGDTGVLIGGMNQNPVPLTIQGITANNKAYNSQNPKIEFKNDDGSQSGQLIWNDHDTQRAPYGLTLKGNGQSAVNGGAYFEVEGNIIAGNEIKNVNGQFINKAFPWTGWDWYNTDETCVLLAEISDIKISGRYSFYRGNASASPRGCYIEILIDSSTVYNPTYEITNLHAFSRSQKVEIGIATYNSKRYFCLIFGVGTVFHHNAVKFLGVSNMPDSMQFTAVKSSSVSYELRKKPIAQFFSGGTAEFSGNIYTTKGICNSWYWGATTNRTQAQWFNVFSDIIPIGKRLNVFGGANVHNSTTGKGEMGIFCFIERLDNDRIELNMFPIITMTADYLTIVQCTRGNTNVVSFRHYIGW
ncbi:phage tail protein [Breznakiella homolactica]|uniref:Tip attachment protein J domain-containing protein n=1 Tax=Breznakiella homolactica TaxID=2798577 RepID=A0A7T7XPR6_9SPIR|nr:phage tail protein [Breznakiella homolactica]QQO10212.1 phage tail protein [Breznakiella homolactica]